MSQFYTSDGTSYALTYKVTQGNTINDTFVLQQGGAVLPLVNWTFYFTVKRLASDPASAALIAQSWSVTSPYGQVTVSITAAKMKTVPVGFWPFDLVGVDASGNVMTILSSQNGGGFLVSPMPSTLEN